MAKKTRKCYQSQWIALSLSLASVVTIGSSARQVLAQQAQSYTVVSGDTLYSIANKHGVSSSDLMTWNQLPNNNIYPGTSLIVSQPSTDSANEIESTTQTTDQKEETTIEVIQQEKPVVMQATSEHTPMMTSSGVTYTVRPGDYLHKIASQFGITVNQLKQWNNLTSNYIYAGDVLRVVAPTNTTPNPTTPTQPTNPNPTPNQSGTTYTVKAGDYLDKIASQYGITVTQLKQWNNLTSNYIYPGDVLKVSSSKTTTPAPKPTPTPTPAPTPSANTYTVKSGDYLHKIANQFGITVDQLKKWNNLTSNYIYAGDVLKVSSTTTTPAPKPTPTPTPAPTPSAKTYTVKSGDYLHKIATQFGITVDQLKKWNNLTSNYIYAGDVLKVSSSTTTTPAPKPTPTPTPSVKTYTVKSGDYLHKIATQFGITVDQLKKWNNLTNNYIYTGDVLKVSAPSNNTPAPKPTPAPTPTPSAKTYTVKSGDYLHKIATQFGITVDQLKKWNNLTNNYIYTGDVLKVSAPSNNTPAPKPTPAPTPTPSAKTYTVKSGDYLYKIATQFGITVDQLKKWNNLTNNYVYAGDVLRVSAPSNSQPIAPAPSIDNLPDLTNYSPRIVNYDVKLNSKDAVLRTTAGLNGPTTNAVNFFGQRFTVRREFNHNGVTYIELLNANGQIVGYVPKTASVVVPQGVNTIYIDAGHGGSESGTVNYGRYEKDLNLNITRQLSQRLRDLGFVVYESRTTDKTIDLRERDDEPNRLMPDAYLSVHHNAMPVPGTAQGIVTLYHDPSIDEPGYRTLDHHRGTSIIPEGKRLSDSIQRALINETGARNMGSRPQNLHVTRTTDVPAALVELGFMDHYGEHQKLITPSYQQKLINGLVKGINAFFGLTR